MTPPTPTGDRQELDLLIDLRERVLDAPAPAPQEGLRTLFAGGAVDLTGFEAPDPWRPRRRRPLVLAGIATSVVLAGTGVAGALPGPAQAAFDRTVGVIGIDLDRTPSSDPAQPVVPELDDAERDGSEQEGDVPYGSNDGRRFAEDTVVVDATDPASPGIDDPAAVADDARDLGTGTDAPPFGEPPTIAPVPVDPAPDPPTTGPPDQEPGGPPTDGGAPAPPDEIAPERPGAGDERGPTPPGGRP